MISMIVVLISVDMHIFRQRRRRPRPVAPYGAPHADPIQYVHVCAGAGVYAGIGLGLGLALALGLAPRLSRLAILNYTLHVLHDTPNPCMTRTRTRTPAYAQHCCSWWW